MTYTTDYYFQVSSPGTTFGTSFDVAGNGNVVRQVVNIAGVTNFLGFDVPDATAPVFTALTGTLNAPTLVRLGNGNYVVAGHDGTSHINFRILEADGDQVLGSTGIGVYSGDGFTRNADLAAIAGVNGGFYLALERQFSATDFDIFVRRLDSAGGSGINLAIENSASIDKDPVITALSGGGFAVAWTRTVGVNTEVRYAVYDGANSQVLGSTTLSSGFGGINRAPSITSVGTGFAVAWEATNGNLDGTTDILVRLYNASGVVQDTALLVGAGDDKAPSITTLSNGMIAVGYTATGAGNGDTKIALFDPSNLSQLATPDFLINGDVSGDTHSVGLQGLSAGRFIVQRTVSGAPGDVEAILYGVIRESTSNGDDDSITGDDFIDYMFGNGGTDTLVGAGGNDELYGGDAADNLSGGEGNDYLEGGPGIDTIQGGNGTDTATYFNSLGGVTVSLLLQGGGQNTIGAGLDTLTGIENLQGSAHDDTLIGDGGINTLVGSEGHDKLFGGDNTDFLFGGLGDDTLNGGSGINVLNGEEDLDTASYAGAPAGVTVSLALLGQAQNTGWGLDTLNSIERIEGSSHRDILFGGPALSYLEGAGGDDDLVAGSGGGTFFGRDDNDRLYSGAGDDWLAGGNGFDSAQYDFAPGPVTVSLALAGPQNTGHGMDILTGIEAVHGSAFGDTLTAAAAGSTLDGEAGDDLLVAGNGNDWLDGGDGTDTVSYANATGTVFANLTASAQTPGASGSDTLLDIENLIGSAHTDLLFGSASINELRGGGGNDFLSAIDDVGPGVGDRLFGEDGDDVLFTSRGDNLLNGGGGRDAAIFFAASGPVTVNLGIQGVGQATGEGVDTLVDIEAVTGSTNADTLTAGDAAHTLSGANGNDRLVALGIGDELFGDEDNDTLVSGAGNDRLNGGTGVDTADYSGFTAFRVVVNLSNTGPQDTEGAGVDTLIGVENVIGTISHDLLVGNEGDNALYAGTGNDVIEGGAGNDIIDGSLGDADFAAYVYAPAGVLVSLYRQGEAQNTIGAGIDTLTGIEFLAGSSFNDILLGDDNTNAIFGSDGDDVIEGGGGVDVLYGGNSVGGDIAAYLYSPSGVTVDLRLQGVTQFTGGAGHDLLDGFESLVGSNFADVLTGDGGVNALIGAAGADILTGGIGFDLLSGGDDADFFVFNAAPESIIQAPDIIVDFQVGVDKLDVRGMNLSAADRVSISAAGGFSFVDIDLANNGSVDFRVILKDQPAITRTDILGVPPASPAAAIALADTADAFDAPVIAASASGDHAFAFWV